MSTSPNPGEVEKISTKPLPDNPARYGYEQGPVRRGFENETPVELTKTPAVTIGPNAAYIVDPALATKLDEIIPEPDSVPVLSVIEPNSLNVHDPDTTVTFIGTNFSESSEIIWNGSGEPTSFIDSEHLATIVKPSTVEAPLPFTLQAWIVNGTLESEKRDFTFTE